MRGLLLSIALAALAAGPVAAQPTGPASPAAPTADPSAVVVPPGWERDGALIRHPLSTLSFADRAGPWVLARLADPAASGFDGRANFSGSLAGASAPAVMTLFLTQPVASEPAMTFLGARLMMEARYQGGPVSTRELALGDGRGALLMAERALAPGPDGQPATDLLLIGTTAHGWQLKLRLTANAAPDSARAAAIAFLEGLGADAGVFPLTPAPEPAFPVCAPRDVRGQAKIRPELKAEGREPVLASMVASLATGRVAAVAEPRCLIRGLQMGSIPILLYRSLDAGAAPSYVAAIADSGVTLTLGASSIQPEAGSGSRKPGGALHLFTFNLPHEVQLLALGPGPVDDNDFVALVAQWVMAPGTSLISASRQRGAGEPPAALAPGPATR